MFQFFLQGVSFQLVVVFKKPLQISVKCMEKESLQSQKCKFLVVVVIQSQPLPKPPAGLHQRKSQTSFFSRRTLVN